MRTIRILFWTVLVFLVLIILYFSTIIIQAVTSDYQPDKITQLPINGQPEFADISDTVFTFLSWNIGYSGLGAEMDFFYDGGKQVHPPAGNVKKYNSGILNFLQSSDTIDFLLLQEVDKNSKRTGKQNYVKMVQSKMPGYTASFGLNYKVKYVPLPFLNPLGKIEMGQMNLSKFEPASSQRVSYYSAYSWPKHLFMLDRCFIVSTFPLEYGKNLVVINTHNSAYDTSGKLRQQEMPVIRDFMLKEFEAGNYVIAGGDWNQNPPKYDLNEIEPGYHAVHREALDRTLFPDDWQIAYYPHHPTNRAIDAPFSKEKTEVTIIDYFIVSPNLQVDKVKTLSQEFEYADHEPVFLKISLKNTDM